MSSKNKEELLQLLLTDVTPALDQFIQNDLYGDVVIAIRGRTLFLQPRVDANVSTSEVERVPFTSEAGGTSADASSTLVKRIASTMEAATTPTMVVKGGETKKGHKRSKTLH